MAQANAALVHLRQPGLFAAPALHAATVFVVACFAGSLQVQPDAPLSVQMAVPGPQMDGWLFRETVSAFMRRYDAPPAHAQVDLAVPVLKQGVGRRRASGQGV